MFRSCLRILRDATRLDIFDLAYEFGSESLNMLSLEPSALPRKGLLKRICIFVFHLITSSNELWQSKDVRIPVGSLIFFVMSKNEKESVMPVFARVQGARWAGYDSHAANGLPLFWAYVISLLYSPWVMAHFLRSRGYQRKSFSYIFDHYWMAYGLYVISRLWLVKLKPKAVVLANDVNTHSRVVLQAARDGSVTTFYLQHASVPENFPPLAFDFALLEGYDALRTHAQRGETTTRVFLVGVPRHDPYFARVNRQTTISAIGICTNGLDPLVRANNLFSVLHREFPDLPLILRPHNADLRIREWRELSEKYRMGFSDSTSEVSFEFLEEVDAIIAGDSNILLEAALMNVLPLCYDFGETNLDWYRFRRNGLVEYATMPEDLCRLLKDHSKHRPDVRPRAEQYCATIGTRYDGRSSELAASLIQAVASGNRINFEEWKRIPDMNMEAYELSCNQGAI